VIGDEARARVPKVAVIADPVAVVSGYGVSFLGDALAEGGALRVELEVLLQRSRVPPERRDEVRKVCAALSAAGVLWRLGDSPDFRAEGSPEADSADGQAGSEGEGGFIPAREAGPLLGVTVRHVRGLAATGRLPARRDSRGHWQFLRADVDAERQRRELVAVKAA
jgi:hypothetical protein